VLFKLARSKTSSHNSGEAGRLASGGFQISAKSKDNHMIGSLMMCVSVVILVVGMLAGIIMGIQQDFALAPAHAHLNLVV
jgi:hypothetical protein